MSDLQNFATFATFIAKEAGNILKEGFGSSFEIRSKDGRNDLVTEYDTKVEHYLKAKIKAMYPDHEILAEESAIEDFSTEKPCWIVDPLDGTVNFAHQIPFFSVSIALVIEKKVMIGVVYHVMQDEMFIAQKGLGSYLNGKKLQVSSTPFFQNAILATGFPYNLMSNPGHCIEHFIEILKQGIPIRRMGSAAIDLCYVAAGRFDGFWEISLKPWDFAAGQLIVEESGGKVSTITGEPLKVFHPSSVLASTPHIYSSLFNQLKLKWN